MPSITVLYHYFYPDDVVSARLYGDLARGLSQRGWDVEVVACNRGHGDEQQSFPLRESWNGVAVRRVWRPALKQSSNLGRIGNALWMVSAWSSLALRRSRPAPDVLLVGTYSVLSVVVAGVMKRARPRVKVAHLVYDLHPEASIAEGMFRSDGVPMRLLRPLLRWAYASCDSIVDIGPAMRRRLAAYAPPHRQATLAPWALAEPAEPVAPDSAVRRRLFGAARLGLLYSGNLGRAHDYQPFLELARRLRGSGVALCFAARGASAAALAARVRGDDDNVRLGEFVPESELAAQLGAADVHLASLRPDWTGLVVPSKFFGSLAVGRPVLFSGDPRGCIGGWIRELGVGWVLEPGGGNIDTIAADMRQLADRPSQLAAMQRRCFDAYRRRCAYQPMLDAWDRELRALLVDSPFRA